MRSPGTGRLRAWQKAARSRPADAGPQSTTNKDPTSSSGSAPASASPAPTDAPDTRTDSDTTAASKKGDPQKPRWAAAIVSQRYAPPFIRRHAQRRLSLTRAQVLVQRLRPRDPDDNRATQIPDDEQIRFPVIWLTELYTPTTLAGLLQGLPSLLTKAHDPASSYGDTIDWVRTSRRQGGGAFAPLPEVLPQSGADSDSYIVDVLPPGIKAVTWSIYTLTSTVTVVTAAFHIQDEHVDELQRIVNRDLSTRVIPLPDGWRIQRPSQQKEADADQWRESLRTNAAKWLADRLPGSFHSLIPAGLRQSS